MRIDLLARRMNLRTSSILLWTASVALAFAAGYFIGVSSGDAGLGDSSTAGVSAANAGANQDESRSPAMRGSERATVGELRGSEARVQAFEALREPDRVKRMRGLSELLAKVTPENWREVYEGFKRQAAAEGRIGKEEWNLMLRQIGRLGRKEAIELVQAEKMSDAKQVFAVLSGWAEMDPEGAGQHWLDGDKYDRTEKKVALYSGMAASNPGLALEKYAFQLGNLATVYDAILERDSTRRLGSCGQAGQFRAQRKVGGGANAGSTQRLPPSAI